MVLQLGTVFKFPAKSSVAKERLLTNKSSSFDLCIHVQNRYLICILVTEDKFRTNRSNFLNNVKCVLNGLSDW